MQRFAWIVCWWACSSPVAAAELFRCVTAAGEVSYQDAPCGEGSRLTKTIDVPAASSGASRSSAKARKPARARSPPIAGGAQGNRRRDGRSRQRESCLAARAERDRKLEALGLNRTFEHLRALDDKVRRVCKDL